MTHPCLYTKSDPGQKPTSLGSEISGEITEGNRHYLSQLCFGADHLWNVNPKGLSWETSSWKDMRTAQEIFSTWGQPYAEPEGTQEPQRVFPALLVVQSSEQTPGLWFFSAHEVSSWSAFDEMELKPHTRTGQVSLGDLGTTIRKTCKV